MLRRIMQFVFSEILNLIMTFSSGKCKSQGSKKSPTSLHYILKTFFCKHCLPRILLRLTSVPKDIIIIGYKLIIEIESTNQKAKNAKLEE